MMDSAALQESWDQVAKSGDEVPLFFYSHLFLSHPELRDMFPISMSAQRDRFVGALGRFVSNVGQLDEVVPFIEQLGRDHRRFSVIPEHYNAVGASLLATLKHFLGPSWTEQLAGDWAAAYGLIARTMVAAAEDATEDAPAWWEAEVVTVDRRTIDIAVLQLRPREPYPYAPGQSFAMEIPQRPRLWRYFSPANVPREDGSIEIHAQLIDGGQVSGALVRSVRARDVVRLGAPIGQALTRTDDDARDLLMVAGGTGLAPLRAVLEGIDRQWSNRGGAPEVQLFHGVRVPWNLYDRDWLRRLQASRPWFGYTEVVSDDSSYPGARGLVGSVAAASGDWHGRAALVCGGPEMVSHTLAELTSAGLPADQISFEQFHHVDDAGDSAVAEGVR